ncbi:TPA: restriction endonuclease subunit S [Staphylococcus aureus]|nr:restriction endonuclease subunit S [Staphylococcus aureus]
MSEQINTPKMRFPEFRDEWEMKIIKELFNVVSGSTPLRSNTSYYENGNIPWVKTTDLNNSLINNTSEKVTDIALNNLKLLPKDTVLIAMYGGFNQIGRTGILNIKATTNQAISALIKKDDYNSKFLQSYLNFNVKQWRRFAASSRKDPNITKKDIEKFKIPYTCREEQEKIGTFFSKLDRQIELEEEKLELLEQQKRGYMQKVFSQELRFKDENGKQYPEGNEYKLNEIGVFNSGIGFPESLQGGIEGIPFFKVSDMNTKGNEIVMKKSNNYVSKEIIDSKKWKVITNGPSMIFAKVGAAIMLNRKRLVLEPFLIDNNTMSYSFSNDWDINFGRILFQTIYLPKYAQVGALPSYNAKDIGTIKVKLPIKQEQEKIGSFFNKIDNLIELQTSKIELLKQRKQGLLQKMFV